MAVFVSITDARVNLDELVDESDSRDVVLVRRGRSTAVLMSTRRHAAIMESMEDMEDRLSIYEREGDTIPFEQVVEELGLGDHPQE